VSELSSVLNKSTWPSDSLKRALFGEPEIAYLCNEFNVDSLDGARIVAAYSLYKRGHAMGERLTKFVQLLKVMPISSASCERGFSQMNLHHASLRNRLVVKTVSDLMMISINGPPLSYWKARKYVLSWLKSGKHGALDKPTGLAKPNISLSVSAQLFL
jgi:hypothetical protein